MCSKYLSIAIAVNVFQVEPYPWVWVFKRVRRYPERLESAAVFVFGPGTMAFNKKDN